MFERFTDQARRVLVRAEEEARALHHRSIRPEHLLLSLAKGEGVAANALYQLGASPEAVRAKVMEAIVPGPVGRWGRAYKVPFSAEAKRALELSLREALAAGHQHIGTEHLLLGMLRERDGDVPRVLRTLGVDSDRLHARVLVLMEGGPESAVTRSPALVEAGRQARLLARSDPVTTGHFLEAILLDNESQASAVLAALGVGVDDVRRELDNVPVATTSDAPPRPQVVEIKLGEATTTIEDPDLAVALSAALEDLSPDQIRSALQKAFGHGAGERPPAADPALRTEAASTSSTLATAAPMPAPPAGVPAPRRALGRRLPRR